MKKSLKLYIDTSVWNFALETERIDSTLTLECLQFLEREGYQLIIRTYAKTILQAFILMKS